MLGTLGVTEDGRFALRFERRFAHPPAKVWRAITQTEDLREWFVQMVDYDRSGLDFTEGAKLSFVAKDDHLLPMGHGEVTRVEPPHLLEYTWDTETLRWELADDGAGGCRLVFTNIFDDRALGTAVGPGWHAGLDMLSAHLDGRPVVAPDLHDLQGEYERAFS